MYEIMKYNMKVTLVFVSVLVARTSSISDDVGLDSLELIKKYGYPFESHYVTTKDGYILHHHRIPHGTDKATIKNYPQRPVALIMHGLLATSADFLSLGPNRSLAFLLADAGYDVWLTNARGNSWSRNHTTLHPEWHKKQFWNFSWHEMGIYDLADSVDYVLDKTGQSSLFFLGHSQGTTAFFVLTSTRPEYNSKIKLAMLMAPSAGTPHTTNMIDRLLAQNWDLIQTFLEMFGIYEVPYLDFIRHWGTTNCGNPDLAIFCIIPLEMLKLLPDRTQFDPASLPVMFTNLPSSSSIKQFIHYVQQIPKGGLYQFDYGPVENLKMYGSNMPPLYNLSKISAPVALFYGNADEITNRQDSEILCDKLPNLVLDYLVPYDPFNHVDFTFGMKAKTLVFDKILNVMKTYKDAIV